MSHHNAYPNAKAPFQDKSTLNDLDREIEKGELRLRYIQLMRDAHNTFGKEDAIDLIRESEKIWEKLTSLSSFS
tara:strand:+ start:113 stop:334 length:222 start_codon:yes stop_codon:yes gene_type:complete